MCEHPILSPERRLHGVAQPEDSPQTQETKLRGESGAGSTAPVARRALPDEYDDGVGRIHVEGHSGNRPQRLFERSRKGECRGRYSAFRGLLRRAGEKTTGARALAGYAESFAKAILDLQGVRMLSWRISGLRMNLI